MRVELTAYKELPEFPSGSGIEFFDDQLYLVGDDARDVLIMNRKWKPRDLVTIFDSAEETIPKKIKADLEATTVVFINKKPHLLILGSGSAELRNRGILLNLLTKETLMFDTSIFYERVKKAGITDLNIEGAALVHDYLVLSNRGNKHNAASHLIITSHDFYTRQQDIAFQLVKLEFDQPAQNMFVSGITYSYKHETLLLTTSTEETDNSVDDGTIGKSGLGFIENFYRKIGREKGKMKINKLVDLPEEDKGFKGFKIESVCIQSEKDHSMKIHLTADNDTGVTYLFKVQLKF